MSEYPLIDTETAIVAKLKTVFDELFPGVLVESAPGKDEENYADLGDKGCVLVRFNAEICARPPILPGTPGVDPSALNIPQANEIEYAILCGVSSEMSENPHHAAIKYLTHAKKALKGFEVEISPRTKVRFFPSRINFHLYMNFTWWYYMLLPSDPF